MQSPSEFRSQFNLSPSQFKRLKSKVAAENPTIILTVQDGNQWTFTEQGLTLLTEAAQSRPPAQSLPSQAAPVAPSAFESALTVRKPAQVLEVVEAEIVQEVAVLDIQLPDHSLKIDRARLEIQHTAHIASGNRAHKRALRRQALIAAAQAEALEDFALADKAYESTMAALEQGQLSELVNSQVQAPAPAPVQAPAATPAPEKK
jgi:hypothetical protein